MKNTYSAKKSAEIERLKNKSLEVGDLVNYKSKHGHDVIGHIDTINGDKAFVKNYYGHKSEDNEVELSSLSTFLYHAGANPFDSQVKIRAVAFTLESIYFQLFKESEVSRYDISGTPIYSSNFDPVVFDKNGEMVRYQRGHVWKLENKMALIESIYNGVDCGKIIVRNRSFAELKNLKDKGVDYLAFKDVVDGKQRLTAIDEFIHDKFADSYGNYFSDLSDKAQREFMNHQLISYAELGEETNDSDVVKTFLRMNFSGIPQSAEHLNYLKSLNV